MSHHPSTVRDTILICLALILVGCRSQKSTPPIPTHTANASIRVSEPLQTPTPVPAVLENGWYVYNDPDGEFSFAYPATTLISAGQNPVDFSKNINLQFLQPDQPYQGMSIRVELNPKQLQGAEIAQQLYEKSAQKPATAGFTNSIQPVLVGGISAFQASIPSTNTELTVIIPYKDKVFIVAPVHELSSIKVASEALELFYQVLNTMKFGILQ